MKNERKERIEIGREIFEKRMPVGTKAVIVADRMKDESDPMTDYYASRKECRVILAFSSHTRDLFKEMRKAAKNGPFEGIKELENAPENWEHREKWSMGAGYYLGKSKYHGWIIRKISFAWDKESLYEAASYEDRICA